MGRIKTRLVKNSANRIFEKAKEELTDDFDKNKTIVAKYAEIPSKKMRNAIVGYVTRLVKVQE